MVRPIEGLRVAYVFALGPMAVPICMTSMSPYVPLGIPMASTTHYLRTTYGRLSAMANGLLSEAD